MCAEKNEELEKRKLRSTLVCYSFPKLTESVPKERNCFSPEKEPSNKSVKKRMLETIWNSAKRKTKKLERQPNRKSIASQYFPFCYLYSRESPKASTFFPERPGLLGFCCASNAFASSAPCSKCTIFSLITRMTLLSRRFISSLVI